MKKLALSVFAPLVLLASGCVTTTTTYPDYYYDCYYDYWGYYVCDYYYYNGDGSSDVSRDIVTDVAQADQAALENAAEHYASKFALSEEQGMKIAKAVTDFSAIQDRSEQDVADFARRLYGVNPSEIVSAVSAAQAGDAAPLNKVVEEAAKNFSTTPENMKEIVKTLHGKLLEEQGIQF